MASAAESVDRPSASTKRVQVALECPGEADRVAGQNDGTSRHERALIHIRRFLPGVLEELDRRRRG